MRSDPTEIVRREAERSIEEVGQEQKEVSTKGGQTSKIHKIELPCDWDAIVRRGGHMDDKNGMRTRGMLIQIG
jgi:hypothetical protein